MSGFKNKKEILKEALLERIVSGYYETEGRLPSESELMKLFPVSQITVKSALDDLAKAGIINKRKGSGSYVSEDALKHLAKLRGNRQKSELRLGLVLKPGYFSNPGIHTFIKALKENLNPEVELVLFFHNFLKPRLYRQAGIDVLLTGYRYSDLELEAVQNENIPLAVMFRETKSTNYILPDSSHGGEMLIKYLYRKGHRKVAVFYFTESSQWEYNDRTVGEIAGAKKIGMKIIKTELTTYNELFENLHQVMEHLFDRDRTFTAICAVSDFMAMNLYDVLAMREMKIPDDISIISFGDWLPSANLYPPLTTVKIPFEQIAARVVNHVHNYLKGKKFKFKEKVQSTIIERESVAQL